MMGKKEIKFEYLYKEVVAQSFELSNKVKAITEIKLRNIIEVVYGKDRRTIRKYIEKLINQERIFNSMLNNGLYVINTSRASYDYYGVRDTYQEIKDYHDYGWLANYETDLFKKLMNEYDKMEPKPEIKMRDYILMKFRETQKD